MAKFGVALMWWCWRRGRNFDGGPRQLRRGVPRLCVCVRVGVGRECVDAPTTASEWESAAGTGEDGGLGVRFETGTRTRFVVLSRVRGLAGGGCGMAGEIEYDGRWMARFGLFGLKRRSGVHAPWPTRQKTEDEWEHRPATVGIGSQDAICGRNTAEEW